LCWGVFLRVAQNRKDASLEDESELLTSSLEKHPISIGEPLETAHMKRFVPILMILTLETLPAQQAPPRPVAEVQGVVVRIATDETLADVTVELTGIVERRTDSFRAGSVFALRAKTDQMGRFRIANVPPGSSYHLVAVRFPEYLPTQYGQRVSALPGLSIDLKPGEVRELRVEMIPSASISGRVLDSTGKAIRTEVQALRPSYWDGYRILSETPLEYVKNNISRTTSSDREGRFRLDGLAAGQVYIFAMSGPNGTASAYFPDSLDAFGATPVDVRTGEMVTDIDITLERPLSRKISGTVIPDSQGVVIRSVEAVLARRDQMRESFLAPYTKKGNRFEFSVYFKGTYNLFLQAMDSENNFWSGRTTIEVKDSNDIKNLQVAVTRPFSISGRVTLDAESVSSPRFDMRALFVDLHPTSSGTVEVPAVGVNADGSFTIGKVTPGDYRVDITPILAVPPGMSAAEIGNAFAQSIRLDGLDILNSGLQLRSRPSESSTGLEVVVSLSGGVLDGRVLNEKREPIPNIRAVLVPDLARRLRRDLYKSAFTNDSGQFQINGIPPGDYKIFSWESVEEGAWQDAAFIRLFEERGEVLHVEPHGVKTVDTVVIPPWN
jgi:hypothetical protein